MLSLAGLVALLSGLSWWQQSRIVLQPLPPSVELATPFSEAGAISPLPSTPGVPASPSADAALLETMRRLGEGLSQGNPRTLLALADPDGLQAAPFTGGLPDAAMVRAMLAGGTIHVRGWRSLGRDGVVVLTDGWQRSRLRLADNVTLEMTPVAALGLVPQQGRWYWRWVMPDPVGALAAQLRSTSWQPWPT
jgi:hypothetical protein